MRRSVRSNQDEGMPARGTSLGFLCLTVLIAAISGCRGSDPEVEALRAEIRSCCPEPAWWSRVEKPADKVRTAGELLEAWQRDDRDDEEFFRIAYRALIEYPDDVHLFMRAASLLPLVADGYAHTGDLLELALDRHFDYDRPLANYGGKAGDTVAGMVRRLAGIHTGRGEPGRAIALIERLLALREKEINDQLLELIVVEHARALESAGRPRAAIEVLERAIDRYHGDWQERLEELRNRFKEGAPQADDGCAGSGWI